MSSGSLFQSGEVSPSSRPHRREATQFVDQDRRPALGEKQDREAGRQHGFCPLDESRLPRIPEACPARGTSSSAPGDTSRSGRRTGAGESTGALEPVEVVELPLLSDAEILADLEVVGQPVDPALDVAVDRALAAIADSLAFQEPPDPGKANSNGG